MALAAQKTIENLFGGISVIGDRPVLVGDVCRFGDRTGTVMHIGLRSTRIRTPERTIVSVPNAQFSAMTLENISGRDKIWFHPTLNLRRDTSAAQMADVLAAFRKILTDHAGVEVGTLPVRFVSVGAYSLDVEVNAYATTSDYDEFLALQQDLLLQMLRAVGSGGDKTCGAFAGDRGEERLAGCLRAWREVSTRPGLIITEASTAFIPILANVQEKPSCF